MVTFLPLVSIVITLAKLSRFPLFPRQREGTCSHLNQPPPGEGGLYLPPHPQPHPHPLPGEGAGPAANRHGHITACIEVAALDANPGAPRKRPPGRTHAVEGWSLWEEGTCWSSRKGLPLGPEAGSHLQPCPGPVLMDSQTEPTGRAQSVQRNLESDPRDEEGR